ncbi:MAG: flagellar hook-associated protein FlgL [Vampirovibrionales bacterium]|nr:flagellar hook-associated protein FlgL [Vampirovibrionales bacterium]
MSINRISNGFMTSQSVGFMNQNMLLLSRLQEKLASGNNINHPSDDPVGLTKILDLTNTLSTDERYARNIQGAQSETQVADSALSSMTELLHRAKDLAIQGANVTTSQTGRNALAQEIDGIINQLVQLGNTSIGGKYIFGGKRTDAPPFDRPPGSDDINYSGNLPTDNWRRTIEISKGVTVDVNLNGQSILGNVQTLAPAPLPPTFSPGSGGVFKTLVELKLDLLGGNTTEIRQRLDEMDVNLDQVLAQQATVGASANRLDLTAKRIEERQGILTQQYADIQNIDAAKLISDLNAMENTFQTSLGVTARVLQPSLLNYLR